MRRLAALVAATVLLVLAATWLAPGPAYACTCRPSTEAEQLERASVAFVGAVVGDRVAGDIRTYTFAVDRVYRGRLTATQDVKTPAQAGACGLELPQGGAYLVLGFLQNGEVVASSCGGTRQGGVPAALGTGYPPNTGSGPRELTWTPANSGATLAIGAVLIGVAVYLARRRSGRPEG